MTDERKLRTGSLAEHLATLGEACEVTNRCGSADVHTDVTICEYGAAIRCGAVATNAIVNGSEYVYANVTRLG